MGRQAQVLNTAFLFQHPTNASYQKAVRTQMLKILSSISETGISELKPHTTPVVVGILGNELRDEISLSLSLLFSPHPS